MDARVNNSEGAAVNTQRHTGVYGNSLGFLAGFSATSHSLSCSLLAQEGEDMQRDYWYTVARDPADLEAAAGVGRTAGEKALARLGARRLSTRKAPVAFTPDLARGLLRSFIGAISGPSQYRKSSFLLEAAGEQIFPSFLGMQERPHIPKALASSPFDHEGAATRDRELVQAGVLEGYVLGSYSARRLGLKSTGNAGGIHNLIVTSSDALLDPTAFLGRLGTGLLVTELMGQGVNGVTGDYSRGASGFWVENGAIAYPGAGDHHRREPAPHVPRHRGARQRRGPPRRHPRWLAADRGDDDRRRVACGAVRDTHGSPTRGATVGGDVTCRMSEVDPQPPVLSLGLFDSPMGACPARFLESFPVRRALKRLVVVRARVLGLTPAISVDLLSADRAPAPPLRR